MAGRLLTITQLTRFKIYHAASSNRLASTSIHRVSSDGIIEMDDTAKLAAIEESFIVRCLEFNLANNAIQSPPNVYLCFENCQIWRNMALLAWLEGLKGFKHMPITWIMHGLPWIMHGLPWIMHDLSLSSPTIAAIPCNSLISKSCSLIFVVNSATLVTDSPGLKVDAMYQRLGSWHVAKAIFVHGFAARAFLFHFFCFRFSVRKLMDGNVCANRQGILRDFECKSDRWGLLLNECMLILTTHLAHGDHNGRTHGDFVDFLFHFDEQTWMELTTYSNKSVRSFCIFVPWVALAACLPLLPSSTLCHQRARTAWCRGGFNQNLPN